MNFTDNPVLFLMLGMAFWAIVIRKGFKMLMASGKSGTVKKAAVGKAVSVIERILK